MRLLFERVIRQKEQLAIHPVHLKSSARGLETIAMLVPEGLVYMAVGVSPWSWVNRSLHGAWWPLARSLHRVSHFSSLRQSPVQYPAHQETTLLATHLTPPIIITMVMVALVLPMMK